jgi:hypothetical protein
MGGDVPAIRAENLEILVVVRWLVSRPLSANKKPPS